jgi:hypothetical protein
MTPDSGAFEKLAAEVASRLVIAFPPLKGVARTGNGAKVTGVSGPKHRLKAVVDDPEILVLVECKATSRRVEVTDLLTLLGRMTDIRAREARPVEAAIATRKGWSSGAERVGQRHGISLWRVNAIDGFVTKLGPPVAVGIRGVDRDHRGFKAR